MMEIKGLKSIQLKVAEQLSDKDSINRLGTIELKLLVEISNDLMILIKRLENPSYAIKMDKLCNPDKI